MRYSSIIVVLLVLVAACKSDDSELSNDCTSTVSRADLADTYADYAVDRLVGFQLSTTSFSNRIEDLEASIQAADIVEARRAYSNLAFIYQNVAILSYGPQGSLMFGDKLNPYPLDEGEVEAFIASGSDTLPSSPNFDRGLPAIEYLLWSSGDSAQTADAFIQNPRRVQTLSIISRQLLHDATTLGSAWSKGRSDFVAATGTGAGSALSTIINNVSRYFEDLRRDKLGTPFGVSTLSIPNPQTVEAPYSEQSLKLIEDGVNATYDYLVARGQEASLLNYLQGLSGTEGAQLVADINQQQTVIATASDAVDEPLAEAVQHDRDDVQQLYNALSRQVVYLKTDVPAVACVAITYVDNPSDSD